MRWSTLITSITLLAALALILAPDQARSQQIIRNQGGAGQGNNAQKKGQNWVPAGVLGNTNRLFDELARGKDTLPIAKSEGLRRLLSIYAKNQGITDEVNREQFASFCKELTTLVAANGVEAVPRITNAWDTAAAVEFGRRDTNGNGVLTPDEMEGRLRDSLDRWDQNGDGIIELAEFKLFYRWKMNDRVATYGRTWLNPAGGRADPRLDEDLDKLPTVFRAGKLPPGLPPWFVELDKDRDGQVGLYEWRLSGRPIAEFQAMDRNGDGLLTAQEVLFYFANIAAKNTNKYKSGGYASPLSR